MLKNIFGCLLIYKKGNQADGEQRLGVLACERCQRACRVGGVVDGDALREQHGAGGDDDEPGH